MTGRIVTLGYNPLSKAQEIFYRDFYDVPFMPVNKVISEIDYRF